MVSKRMNFSIGKDSFLPAYNLGILLVSTSKGIMSHTDAQSQGLGGVLVGYVY
jgi:small subunit ribosomal protein S8